MTQHQEKISINISKHLQLRNKKQDELQMRIKQAQRD